MSALLPALVGAPLAGCLLLTLLPRRSADRAALPVGLAASGVSLLLAIGAVLAFDFADPARMQLGAAATWVPRLGIEFRRGVDGV